MKNLNTHTPKSRARKALGIPDPIHQFRIHPERPYYFNVEIYRTWQQLYRMRRFYFPTKPRRTVFAFVANAEGQSPYLGTVCFCVRDLSEVTVVHEMVHAAFWWASTVRLNATNIVEWNHPTHERIAEVIGRLATQARKRLEVLEG